MGISQNGCPLGRQGSTGITRGLLGSLLSSTWGFFQEIPKEISQIEARCFEDM